MARSKIRTSSPRSTSVRTVSTWSVPATHTGPIRSSSNRLREMVRLAAGLDEQGRLDRGAMETAIACLERFGQRLRDLEAESVTGRFARIRCVARSAKEHSFDHSISAALGHPIEIISGIEEARLIYLGVSHTMPQRAGTPARRRHRGRQLPGTRRRRRCAREETLKPLTWLREH